MRSRYSAFCLANVDYLDKTMQGKTRLGLKLDETKTWAESVCWLGLEIIETADHPSEQNHAFVEFIARFMIKDKIQFIHERSEFECKEGKWYYIDGIKPKNKHTPKTIKISKNAPCPCNSLKKFKNCHGAV